MQTVDHRTATRRIKTFMANCSDKVQDILIRHYKEDAQVREEIDVLLEEAESESHTMSGHPPQSPSRNIPTSPTGPEIRGQAYPSGQRHARQHSSSMGPHVPSTPPQTASSVKSHASKSARASEKYVVIVSQTEDDIEEAKVRFGTAPIPHSVVREAVVERPEFRDDLFESDLDSVWVPYSTRSSELREVAVIDSIKLTWSRLGAKTTHRTIFYVVANDMLDIDLILGSKDTGEPTQASNSFHLSAETSNDSAHATAARVRQGRDQQDHPYRQNVTETMYRAQRAHDTGTEYPQPIRRFSTNVRESPPRVQVTTSLPVRPAPDSSAPIPTSDPNVFSGRLRLEIDWVEWGKNPIMVWLDMCAPSDAFFQSFHKCVKKRLVLEREETTIYLKGNKDTPEEEEYPLLLGADELDADWKTTLEWLRNNKSEESPNVYGRVEVGDG